MNTRLDTCVGPGRPFGDSRPRLRGCSEHPWGFSPGGVSIPPERSPQAIAWRAASRRCALALAIWRRSLASTHHPTLRSRPTRPCAAAHEAIVAPQAVDRSLDPRTPARALSLVFGSRLKAAENRCLRKTGTANGIVHAEESVLTTLVVFHRFSIGFPLVPYMALQPSPPTVACLFLADRDRT